MTGHRRFLLLRAGALAITVGVALGLRKSHALLPVLLWSDGPDLLYTVAVFWLLRLVFPRHPARVPAVGAVAFSWLVEFSQLSQLPIFASARSTTLGALILGRGFQLQDLVSYVLGGLLAAVIDLRLPSAAIKPLAGEPADPA